MNTSKNTYLNCLLAAVFAAALLGSANINAGIFNTPLKPLPERYQFDELPEVKSFSNWTINGWTAVDRQSLIVRTSPSTSYLLVLQRGLPDLNFSKAIALSSTASRVKARFDTVNTIDRRFRSIPVAIAKIYKLKGRDQRKQVKAQIRMS